MIKIVVIVIVLLACIGYFAGNKNENKEEREDAVAQAKRKMNQPNYSIPELEMMRQLQYKSLKAENDAYLKENGYYSFNIDKEMEHYDKVMEREWRLNGALPPSMRK